MIKKSLPIQPRLRINLQQTSYQILALLTHIDFLRKFHIFSRIQSHLILQQLVSVRIKRHFPIQHVIVTYSNTPQISFRRITLIRTIQQQFRSHRKRCTQICICHLTHFSKSEISYHHNIIIQKNISQFHISMHDVVLMKHFKSIHYLLQKVYCFSFLQMPLFLHVLFQITVIAKLNDQIVVSG